MSVQSWQRFQSSCRAEARILLALACLHLAYSYFINPVGHFTGDSVTYHLMVKTLAEKGGFDIENGYREFPSPELLIAQLRAPDGRSVAQYPEIYTFLTLPFYLCFGFKGLYLLNSLAFLVINVLVFKIAQLAFASDRIAYLSVSIYVLATYAWEYSQSSYPHLTATMLIAAAFYLAFRVVRQPCTEGVARHCMLAGFLGTLAVGVRLDSAFALPALGLPLIFSKPVRVREIVLMSSGAASVFLLLSWINFTKFGTWVPLQYGTQQGYANLSWYVPLSLFIFVCISLYFVALRSRRFALLCLAVLSIPAMALYWPALWAFAVKLSDGVYQIVVDMRIRDMDRPEPGLSRTASGAMVYLEHVKKSLIQSCPYLVLLLVPIWDILRRRRSYPTLSMLILVPAVYIGFFGYLAWHGSVCLNMRYLNPILPFTSILTAYACREILGKLEFKSLLFWSPIAIPAILLAMGLGHGDLSVQETVMLNLPLALAALILIGYVASALRPAIAPLGALARVTVLAGFVYSNAVAFGADYIFSSVVRSTKEAMVQPFISSVPPDSLIHCEWEVPCVGLIDRVEGIRIANPALDGFADFQALTKFHLDHGRRVFFILSPERLEELRNTEWFRGLTIVVRTTSEGDNLPSAVLIEITKDAP